MGSRFGKALIWFVLFGALAARAEQLPVKTYTIADGLARDYVNDIKQDSHGFLWFCTAEGVSRFDGYSFSNYGINDGLPNRVVNDFIETPDGDHLFGTDAGLVLFDPNGGGRSFFRPIPLSSHDIAIFRLVADPKGVVWAGTSDGAFILEKTEGQWQPKFVDLGIGQNDALGGVASMIFDADGSAWITTGAGGLFHRMADSSTERYTVQNGLPHNGLTAILKDNKNQIWVGTPFGLLLLKAHPRPGETIVARTYTPKDGLGHNFIDCLFQSSDGRLWVGTRGGVNVLVDEGNSTGSAFRSYTGTNGIPNIRINCIFEDLDQNVWIGAENGGAIKIPLSGFTSYFDSDGLEGGRINQLFADQQGHNYVLSSDPGKTIPILTRIEGKELIKQRLTIPPDTTLSWGWNQQVAQDAHGYLWLATEQGVFQLGGGVSPVSLNGLPVKHHYTVAEGIDDNSIFRLFVDSHDNVWFSTIGPQSHSCFHKLDRSTGEIRYFTPEEIGRPPSAATAFANGPDGSLWMGFYTGGIMRYRDGQFTHFTVADGVPPGFVRHLFFDSKKRLWVATSLGGVARVDDTAGDKLQFITYTHADGLASDQVTTVTEDRFGQIYLGTGRGIDRLNVEDGAIRKIKHYTIADGLADNFINVSFCDAQGVLWFGTLHGLSRLVPQQDELRKPPPIMISGLNIAGEKQPLSALGVGSVNTSELAYTQNQLQIDFLSISYAAGDALLYQYKFEDGEWSPPSQQRSITLANLSPGGYRFLVRAVNSDGVASALPASVSFKILSPIWGRWWFIALAVLMIIILAIGFYLYRTTQLRTINRALTDAKLAEVKLRLAREERLAELEKVRSRIATDLHDDIGASLTQIAILSEVAQAQTNKGNGAATGSLTKISQVSNELVGTMSDIVWSINPAKDHVSDVTQRMRRFAADVLTLRSIRFHFRSGDDVADIVVRSNLRREVFLIFKESINNAVKHSNAKNVWTDVDVVDGKLTVTIRDDGQGFDPADLAIKDRGNGLASMRRRTLDIGGEYELRSKPGGPTEITFALPIEDLSATSA